MFYTITYGITLGIAFAEDMLTMYFFYELLTMVTVPLVLHTLTKGGNSCQPEIPVLFPGRSCFCFYRADFPADLWDHDQFYLRRRA